jgi:hypothetical protein
MGVKIKQGKCKECGKVKVEINTTNHLLHFFLSIFTGGLWLIIWLLLGLTSDVRCYKCGGKARKNWFS